MKQLLRTMLPAFIGLVSVSAACGQQCTDACGNGCVTNGACCSTGQCQNCQAGDWQSFGNCMTGSCMSGDCQLGGGCPFGLSIGANTCMTNSCLNGTCLGQCMATKAYPDAGWAPPARYPVNRDGIWYQSYQPNQWYGTPGGGFVSNYPMVYQPTDTTQLGYSYARVPTWRPRPGMLPPAPHPSAFHARGCPSAMGTACPCQGQAMMVHAAAVAPRPVPTPAVGQVQHAYASAPVKPARKSSWFRLASLKNLFD